MKRRVTFNPYKNQTAVIRVEGHERVVEVGKGVRVVAFPPMLFNLYIEQPVKEYKEKFERELKFTEKK